MIPDLPEREHWKEGRERSVPRRIHDPSLACRLAPESCSSSVRSGMFIEPVIETGFKLSLELACRSVSISVSPIEEFRRITCRLQGCVAPRAPLLAGHTHLRTSEGGARGATRPAGKLWGGGESPTSFLRRTEPAQALDRDENIMKFLMLDCWMVPLLVLCWPLALLHLILPGSARLTSLPFRLVFVAIEAAFALIRTLVFLPARLLGWRRSDSHGG